MKKIFSLLLVLTMILSLCACGVDNMQTESTQTESTQTESTQTESTQIDKNIKDAYIGVWETKQLRLMITKGGVGKWGFLVDNKDFDATSFPINWEIKDEVLAVTFSIAGFDYNAAFELDDSATILHEIQKSGAFSGDVENDTEYVKIP